MVAEEGDRNSSKMYLPSISLHSYYFRKLKSEESRDECGRKMDRGMGYRMEKALFSPNSWSLLFYYIPWDSIFSSLLMNEEKEEWEKLKGRLERIELPSISSSLSSFPSISSNESQRREKVKGSEKWEIGGVRGTVTEKRRVENESWLRPFLLPRHLDYLTDEILSISWGRKKRDSFPFPCLPCRPFSMTMVRIYMSSLYHSHGK